MNLCFLSARRYDIYNQGRICNSSCLLTRTCPPPSRRCSRLHKWHRWHQYFKVCFGDGAPCVFFDAWLSPVTTFQSGGYIIWIRATAEIKEAPCAIRAGNTLQHGPCDTRHTSGADWDGCSLISTRPQICFPEQLDGPIFNPSSGYHRG